MASEEERPRRANQRERYIVENMPPIWRRSLTEAGMERRTTVLDHIVVGLFVVIFLTVAVLILVGQIT